MQTIVHLSAAQFSSQENLLAEHGELRASAFRYASGVCAIRLTNSLGELVMLPYQGQQIWDASMRGRRLTMKSMFDQPLPTRDFLASYGGFLLHCGATGMGVPGPEDKHTLHGELHSAPYQAASLILGSDEKGDFIGLTGIYRHTLAFHYNYTAKPLVKLYADRSVFDVSMEIQNQKASPMPVMFLEHVNFLPVDNARLAQTVVCSPETMRIRDGVGPSADVAPGCRDFVKSLQRDPQQHLCLRPGQVYDPEVVLYLTYLADENGWAHTLQVHPDGGADVLRHRPEQLNHGVRWLCRTPDQDAFGIEPSTAEVDGFSAEKAKGHVRILAGGETFRTDLQIGVLDALEAQREEALIERVLTR